MIPTSRQATYCTASQELSVKQICFNSKQKCLRQIVPLRPTKKARPAAMRDDGYRARCC